MLTEVKYTPTHTPKTVTHVLDMPSSPWSGSGPIITEVLGGQEHTYCNLSNDGESDSESSGLRPNQLFMNTPNKPLVCVMEDNSASGVHIKSEPLSPAPSPKPNGQVDDMVSENFGLDELMELADRKHSVCKPVTDAVEDSLKFWEGIIALGLMEDFMKEIKISLDILKQRLVHPSGDIEREAVKLSSVVKDLGLFRVLHEKMVDLQRETHEQQYRLNAEISVLEKQWSETQKRKGNLAKRQQLLDQVKTSSRIKKRNGVQRTDVLAPRKHVSHPLSKNLERARSGSPLATKTQDSTIIITVNEGVDGESCVPTPSENEDFLVTITSGRTAVTMEDGLKDKILNERQQELDGDMEVKDPLQIKTETPIGGKRKYEDSEIVSNGSSRRKRQQAERIVNAQEDE
ncbi:uncharacterized protein LOC135464159 [Liolophura sinensis]|uniref:uncharacterized protein LOC135464159 n=1 Tax=Liolophura sinensis TaxID=3198878 RepID=UPI0031580B70